MYGNVTVHRQGLRMKVETKCPLALKVPEMNGLLKVEETLSGDIDYLRGQKLFRSCS